MAEEIAERQAEEAAMEMPRPGEAHAKLARLAGRFEARETMCPSPWDPEGGQRRALTVNRMSVDGLFLVNEYTQLREGEVVVRGLGIYGWVEGRARFSMYWVDSMGTPPAQTIWGTWEDDTLVFAQEGPRGHVRYVYDVGERGYRFRLETSRDGVEWAPMIDGVYERVSDA